MTRLLPDDRPLPESSDGPVGAAGSTRTGILGWGSLLWEGGPEFDRHHDTWSYDGPVLPVEFSRVSASRLGALTLVVDPNHGWPTTVAWCLSSRRDPADSVADLRCREGTTIAGIGRIGRGEVSADTVRSAIAEWAEQKKLDTVVWTALDSNFRAKTGVDFSVEAAVKYLAGLPSAAKAKAAEYVWRAPDFVRTALRSALQAEPWFETAARTRHGSKSRK